MAGILLRHVGQTAVVLAGITGAIAGLTFGFMDIVFTPIGQLLTGNAEFMVKCPSPFLIIPLSWLVTFLLSAVLGGFFAGPTLEQVRQYTWVGAFYEEKDRV